MNRPVAPATGSGDPRADCPFPRGAGRPLADTQLRANLRHATHTIRAKRAAGRRRGARLGGTARRRRGDQGPRPTPPAGAAGAVRGGGHRRRRPPCTGPGTPTRPAGSSPSWSRPPAPTRSSRSSRWRPRRSGSTRRWRRPASPPYETDLAELIVQLGDDTPSHILVPAIHRNRTEIRDIFQREMPDVAGRPHRRAAPRSPRRPARTCGEVSSRQGRRLRRQLRHRRDRHAGGRGVRGQRADVPHAAGDADQRRRHREAAADLRRPGGLPAAAAALLDRRADEPVHLDVDRRHPRDGPQDVHLVLLDNGRTEVLADPVGRQALRCIRCSACLNVCPVYERAGGHAYGSVYPGPIGAILTPQLSGVARQRAPCRTPRRSAAPATRSAR